MQGIELTSDAAGGSLQPDLFQQPRLLRRVRIKNYKSIGSCDVELGPLTFLVGRNGAGKSNFLEALRFVADSLKTTLDHALRDRGGINDVRRRSGGHPNHFGIRLDFQLPDGQRGHYSFRVAARPQGGHEVQTEECFLLRDGERFGFVVEAGLLTQAPRGLLLPAASSDRLYLVNVSGVPEFRPVYDAFSRMGFYNLNPDRIRDLQSPDAGQLLARDGANIASVLGQLSRHNPQVKKRIEEYLGKVVPGIQKVDEKVVGPKETLEFRQTVKGSSTSWRFLAANMSDGTLRGLGILVALFQRDASGQLPVPVVGIEEPELALHPAAAGVLLDSLRDASNGTQVIVTSHSPDLLDDRDIDPRSLLAVYSEGGNTEIAAPLTQNLDMLRSHLYTAGELIRLDQLRPDRKAIEKSKQLRLFDEVGG